MVACQKVNLEIVTYLMKSGANIAEKDCVSLVISPRASWVVQNLFLFPTEWLLLSSLQGDTGKL